MTFAPQDWPLRLLRGQGTLSSRELEELLAKPPTGEAQLERDLAPARHLYDLPVTPALSGELRSALKDTCTHLRGRHEALSPELWAGMVAAQRVPECLYHWSLTQTLDTQERDLLNEELQLWSLGFGREHSSSGRLETRLVQFTRPPEEAWVHVGSKRDFIWQRFIQSQIPPERLNLRSAIQACAPHLMQGPELNLTQQDWYEWDISESTSDLCRELGYGREPLERYLRLSMGPVSAGPLPRALAALALPQVEGNLSSTQAALNTAVILARLTPEARQTLLAQSQAEFGGQHRTQALMAEVALSAMAALLEGPERAQTQLALRDLRHAMRGEQPADQTAAENTQA